MSDAHNNTEIKVKPYGNVSFEQGWKGRSAGLWGIAGLGLVAGVATGAVAPFFPVIAGVQDVGVAAGLATNSMAIFGALGLGAGFSTGVARGIAAGTTSGVAAEQEKRDREREIALVSAINPGASLPKDVEREEAPDTRSGWQKFKEELPSYVNLKVGAAFSVLGMLGGAVMAAAYFALGGPEGAGASAAMPGMRRCSAHRLPPTARRLLPISSA